MKILAGTSILKNVVFDRKQDRLPPRKGHLLNETFATVASNLSLVRQDIQAFDDLQLNFEIWP